MRLPPLADPDVANAKLKSLFESDPPYGAQVIFNSRGGATGWNAPELVPWLEESVNRASEAYFGKRKSQKKKKKRGALCNLTFSFFFVLFFCP